MCRVSGDIFIGNRWLAFGLLLYFRRFGRLHQCRNSYLHRSDNSSTNVDCNRRCDPSVFAAGHATAGDDIAGSNPSGHNAASRNPASDNVSFGNDTVDTSGIINFHSGDRTVRIRTTCSQRTSGHWMMHENV
jgi:hypothetical protein